MGTSFLGMRGTGDWGADERPTEFREGVLRIDPNGDAPLLAITSKARKTKPSTSTKFTWWSQSFPDLGGTCAGVWKEAALSNQYGGGDSAASGTLVYCQCAAAVASGFRPGNTAIAIDQDDESKSSFGRVMSVSQNGSSSYVCLQLRASSGTGYLNAVDFIDLIGDANPEGSPAPDAVTENLNKWEGFTMILQTALDLTGTQMAEHLRPEEAYARVKRDTTLRHGLLVEKSMIFTPVSSEDFKGENGKPERYCKGLIPFIKDNASDNVSNFVTAKAGYTWAQEGENWMDEMCEQLFRYGPDQRLALCGSKALLGIAMLAKLGSTINLTARTGSYGVSVVEWVTPFGSLMLKRHPLFSLREYLRRSMVILPPENVQYTPLKGRDTMFCPDPNFNKGGHMALDGLKEHFKTEAGWGFHFPETMGYLTNVGADAD